MEKLFFELDPVQDGDPPRFRARLRITDALKASPDGMTERIALLEYAYTKTIIESRELYNKIRASGRGKKLFLYWELADVILHFLRRTDREGFFLNYPNRHFARDLEVTGRMIGYLLAFRKKIADKKQLDPAKPWSCYVQSGYRKRKNRKYGPSVLKRQMLK